MSSGGTTTTVDSNNPYSNALSKNAMSAYGLYTPFLKAQLEGQKTPFSDITNIGSQMTAKHFAGKYGQPIGDANLQDSFMKGDEALTMPNESALAQIMSMYGVGSPSGGGTTQYSKQNMGSMEQAQLALSIAALAAAFK